MTTKPKARKFRIRRNPAAAGNAAPETVETEAGRDPRRVAPPPDGAFSAPKADPYVTDAAQRATPRPEQPPPQDDPTTSPKRDETEAQPTPAEVENEAIRQEGLTSRQLRMARRVAQRHDLPATSDEDAVRLLRQNGIDPFRHANMLELVVPRKKDGEARVQLPQTVEQKPDLLPSTELDPARRREREISEIQRDIVRRRRRTLALLAARLAFFVGLPTLICGYYFYNIATPMYSSDSEFLILQADGGSGQVAGLLTGTQFATSQDSTAVQSFLESKDAMVRLDRDAGFQAHYSQPWIDPIQRLPADASTEETYKTYKKAVKIGYDPTEGVLRMEVTAANPETATEFSRRLISYAEDRVNDMSREKRGDQMEDAEEALAVAEQDRRDAQEALIKLQQKNALIDPEGRIASLRTMISTFETQLEEKELELAALEDNLRPNQAKVDGVKGDIRRLTSKVAELNDRMTQANQGEESLASMSVQMQMAQADLATRDMMMQSALQQVEQTRMEANRQVRYLTISVQPIPSEEPSSPRKFENTVLAFLIFGGIYLMISLTASILREQVST
ncbi:capsule biosynthesis protein [Chachezhania antarctica]|uniref:capsule biosynthesis protein n=1 Tax=Chachezhania antarctica TaxID=2340860 RepID=UPI000EB0A33B|nr:capsule biosynthesis protein [Chachezhania antarctica]